MVQAMPSASPTKWHRAHTTWFFDTFVLEPRGLAVAPPGYAMLFNSYYEAVGPRHPRPKRGALSRPSCDEVRAYRGIVDERMLRLLSTASSAEIAALGPLVELGIAHEEQHQELLLTDILHAFSVSPLQPAYQGAHAGPSARRAETAPPCGFAEQAGGVVEIGHGGEGFSFDNEGPRHRVFVEPFALATRPVIIAELRAFIEAGGYRTPSLWLSDGFERVRAAKATAPHNCVFEPGSLRMFTLGGMLEADDHAPAWHLDYYEADAIARFLGGRLPTEAEWECVARAERPSAGNFCESGALRPRAVGAPATGEMTALFGDVWEWTSSAYAPYPGFAPAEGAVGEYNGKFMVNQLVLRGGSCFTPAGHVRASYRNFWPPDTAFQMSGARVARDVRPSGKSR